MGLKSPALTFTSYVNFEKLLKFCNSQNHHSFNEDKNKTTATQGFMGVRWRILTCCSVCGGQGGRRVLEVGRPGKPSQVK